MVIEFELIGGIDIDESDTDGGISGSRIGGVLNVGDGVIVWGESFEDVVVVVEIEGDGFSQDVSP